MRGRQMVGKTQSQMRQLSQQQPPPPSTIKKTASALGRFSGVTPGKTTGGKLVTATLYGTGSQRGLFGAGGDSTPVSDVYSAVRNQMNNRQDSGGREKTQQQANPAVDALRRALDRRKNQ